MKNAKVEIANPVPTPSHVGVPLPSIPEPVAKEGSVERAVGVEGAASIGIGSEVDSGGVDLELQKKLDAEVDANPKGTIVIKLFENSPYEIDFSGVITGTEVDLAWRFLMKEYRVWKHRMFKKLEQDKKDGGG